MQPQEKLSCCLRDNYFFLEEKGGVSKNKKELIILIRKMSTDI